jgi:heat shock protein beta
MRKLASFLCIAASLWCARARAADTDGDSLDDAEEMGDFDGDGVDDWMDSDDDNDFVSTLDERQRAPQSGDSDGDNAVDWLDKDDDNDGLPTMAELGAGGGSAPRDTDGDHEFDYLDDDDDGDGEPTATERQSAPPEPDVNHNNVPDYLDPAAFGSEAAADPNEGDVCQTPSVTDAGLPVCWEQDHDGDGIWSSFEGAPTFTLDTDRDGTVDFLDADDDGDGLPSKAESPDANHDGNPDDARDTSGNGVDYLNPDDDDDHVPTLDERPGGNDRDTDLDGRPNHIDDDDDGDGISTRTENAGPDGIKADANGNGVPAYLDADEKYVPPTDMSGGTVNTDAGVPIATLDAGSTPAAKDAGSTSRRDANASASDAGESNELGDDEDPFADLDPESPAMTGGKGSGCSLPQPRAGGELVNGLSSLLFALGLLFRRRAR